jgi:hypothetical protein
MAFEHGCQRFTGQRLYRIFLWDDRTLQDGKGNAKVKSRAFSGAPLFPDPEKTGLVEKERVARRKETGRGRGCKSRSGVVKARTVTGAYVL